MKIVDIRTIPLSYRCEPPYGSAGGMQARRGGLLVEIETDERVIGIGEAGVGGGATAGVIEKVLQPMLIGEDPLLIEGLWQKMFARTRQFGRRGDRHERDQRHRHRAVGHRRQGRQNAALSPVRRLPRPGRGLCQRRLLPGGQIGRRSRRRGRGLSRPRLQRHEDEGRAQPFDANPSAPSGGPCRAVRGRARRRHCAGRRGAPRAGPAGQADGRRQLRLEPGLCDRDGPRDRAL